MHPESFISLFWMCNGDSECRCPQVSCSYFDEIDNFFRQSAVFPDAWFNPALTLDAVEEEKYQINILSSHMSILDVRLFMGHRLCLWMSLNMELKGEICPP